MARPMLHFTPSMFTPTKWSSAEEKARFANDLLHFIHSNFEKRLFTEKLYQRLSACFRHIAHYDRHGFWEEWFETAEARKRFLENIDTAPCWGDPAFTYSDVERAVQHVLASSPIRSFVVLEARRAEEAIEREQLRRLSTKYEAHREAVMAEPTFPTAPFGVTSVQNATSVPVQQSLF